MFIGLQSMFSHVFVYIIRQARQRAIKRVDADDLLLTTCEFMVYGLRFRVQDLGFRLVDDLLLKTCEFLCALSRAVRGWM